MARALQRKVFVRANDGLSRLSRSTANNGTIDNSMGCAKCRSRSHCVCGRLHLDLSQVCVDWATLPRHEWPSLISSAEINEPLAMCWAARQTPLSIKFAVKAQETYNVDGRGIGVDPHTYLIINEGTSYSSELNSADAVHSLGVFFSAQLCADVISSLGRSSNQLLDFRPDSNVENEDFRFVEKLYPADALISPRLRLIANLMRGDNHDQQLEEQLYGLAEDLFKLHHDVLRDVEQLPFAKSSTRLEVYKRLAVCHDYMLSNLSRQLTISSIAAVAGFSTHHFLRVFKEVYGKTPHQYLTAVRMERARHMLHHSRKSVIDISGELGFESPTSFSALYKRHFNAAPMEDRKHASSS